MFSQTNKTKIKNAAKRTRQHARIVFHKKLSSTEGRLPPQVVFHRRISSTEGCLPSMVVFHRRSSSTYHNTLVDIIFVRATTHCHCSKFFYIFRCRIISCNNSSNRQFCFENFSSETEPENLCGDSTGQSPLFWLHNGGVLSGPGDWKSSSFYIKILFLILIMLFQQPNLSLLHYHIIYWFNFHKNSTRQRLNY